MDRPETIAVKYEPMTVESPASSSAIDRPARPPKLVVLADLNFNPPETDDLDSSVQIPTPHTTRYPFLLILTCVLTSLMSSYAIVPVVYLGNGDFAYRSV